MVHLRDSSHDDLSRKRKQILDAAFIVFSRKGYHRATIDEIITLADTGKGTVYNYFANKEKLFYTLVQEISQPFETALVAVLDSERPPLEKVESLIRLFLDFYVTNGGLWRVLMHELRGFGSEGYSSFSAEQREKYHSFFQNTVGTLARALEEGITAGVIKPCDTVKVAHGVFSVIVMMVFQDYVHGDTAGTANTIANTFFYGIANT